ncbi:MAG: hypothetical protein AB7F35_30945 [Acetobacteraceae bacterium]
MLSRRTNIRTPAEIAAFRAKMAASSLSEADPAPPSRIRRNMTPAERAQFAADVLRLWNEGNKLMAIAAELDVSFGQVQGVVAAHKAWRGNRRGTDIARQKIPNAIGALPGCGSPASGSARSPISSEPPHQSSRTPSATSSCGAAETARKPEFLLQPHTGVLSCM